VLSVGACRDMEDRDELISSIILTGSSHCYGCIGRQQPELKR
jgi:hypothetical protein